MIKEDHFACKPQGCLRPPAPTHQYTGARAAEGLVHTLAASDYSIAKELRQGAPDFHPNHLYLYDRTFQKVRSLPLATGCGHLRSRSQSPPPPQLSSGEGRRIIPPDSPVSIGLFEDSFPNLLAARIDRPQVADERANATRTISASRSHALPAGCASKRRRRFGRRSAGMAV